MRATRASARRGAPPALLAGLLIALLLPGCGDNDRVTPAPTAAHRLSLNGTWRFRADPDNRGRTEQWFRITASNEGWTDITVPGNWNFLFRDSATPTTDHDYEGVGWYRTTFGAPMFRQRAAVRLHVGASSYKTTVWVNESVIGEHEGDFLPFEFDVTDRLHYGATNTLALRVESLTADSALTVPPARGRYDYWIYSGVHRDVYLEAVGPLSVYDAFVHAEPNGDGTAAFGGRVQLLNAAATEQRAIVRLTLRPAGSAVASWSAQRTVVVPPSSLATLAVETTLTSVRQWSPDTPHLYECLVELVRGNGDMPTAAPVTTEAYNPATELPAHAALTRLESATADDAAQVTFGIRTVRTAGTQILLNGQPLILRGVNRHDEYPLLGRTVPDRIYEDDFALIKRLGANALRTAHYPNDPRVYDLADRVGLLVIEEVPCTGLTDDEMQTARVQALALAQSRAMVIRDRNHPSIILWSAGNEPEPAGDAEFNAQQYAVMKALDPTRLVSYARVLYDNKTRDPASDVIMLNPYFGWYVSAVSSLNQFLDQTHRLFPDKPMLLSEFGADAVKDQRTNTNPATSPHFSEDFQAHYLSETWRITRSKDYMSGGFIWVFADFLSPTREFLKSSQTPPGVRNPLPYRNLKGLMTEDRVPKNAYLTALGMFHDAPLHALTVRVVDGAGAPVVDAEVDLDVPDGSWVGHQRTDARGAAVFWLIPDGGYAVRVRRGERAGGASAELAAQDAIVTVPIH